ncbi:hypothetical protein CHGG_10086 [Chaetomium globosum CBS 148.51]|uniref:Peptidase S8/S53 domain-containing protein n=1 Tax=Chaetomium globosum (strain ATCC 6205 / CBS 148.51 / DSM 1962 / NBRC 6347 / NRRL 1970) TaxID=306901 RepID=Q2GPL8_CHAGB|nr:uncharacterized protein CHGG_10086 [Chaetomium globosum CBS 148.51]EAQ83682.1 hypothetical protein CHGG_10086 [Chaetomium globosum CBS 148.51]
MHFFAIVGLAAAIASPLASGAVTPPAPNLARPPLPPIPVRPRSASAVVLAKNNEVPEDLVIPDTYIIRYKPSLDVLRRLQHEEDIDRMAKKDEKRGIFDRFDIPGLQGYVAEISPSELKNLTECDLKDTIIKTTAVAASPALAKRTMVKQYNAPWGLARISHYSRHRRDYVYSDTAGTGTVVYVVDTGIRTSHADFNGRAIWGANFLAETSDSDEDGHGTHVAAIIAGSTYGVAKNATVIAVKVLDKTGSGSMSGLLQGLNWAVDDARRRGVVSRTVINLSVAGTYTQSVNDAIKIATDAGITVVAAAGNKNDDVANWSPGSAPTAITVGAIDEDDRRGEFSNWGPGVDIFAPGVSINSAYNTGDYETAWLSGTSMATPHVAGLAAYFMAREGLSGSEVTERILGAANKGVADRHEGADRIATPFEIFISSLSLLFLSISATSVTTTSPNCPSVNPSLSTTNRPSFRLVPPPASAPSLATNLATYPPTPPSSTSTNAPSSTTHFNLPCAPAPSPVQLTNFLRNRYRPPPTSPPTPPTARADTPSTLVRRQAVEPAPRPGSGPLPSPPRVDGQLRGEGEGRTGRGW